MNTENMKKGICKLQLNNISPVENDQTLVKLTFSILDFDVSGNKQIVSKELALEASPTFRLKPLVCQYFETTDYINKNDHFGNHGSFIGKDRDGNDILLSNAIAIGTSNETGAYLGTIKDENNNDVEVLLCDFFIWADRFPNIIALINEMWEAGIPLKSSCEYLYKNYQVIDGIQHILSPLIFVGHCVLKSNENNMGEIEPAYQSSQLINFNEKWNKAVSQAIQNQNSHKENVDINNTAQKEVNILKENMFYKALCELSFGDIREQIMSALSKTMTADEFYSVWVSNYGIYDDYFVYETYQDDKYINFKVPYTKSETEVVIDLANKTQVERDTVWVEVSVMNQSINELNIKIDDLNTQLNTANKTISTLTTEKENIEKQFNDATEKITSLNAKVEEMTPIVEQYNSDLVEKAINEKKEYYSTKFKAVNALEKFESEEVQELIKKSINDNQEGKEAILSLNTMLVDMVQIKSNEKPMVKEVASKHQNLIPTGTDFESRYSI